MPQTGSSLVMPGRVEGGGSIGGIFLYTPRGGDEGCGEGGNGGEGFFLPSFFCLSLFSESCRGSAKNFGQPAGTINRVL